MKPANLLETILDFFFILFALTFFGGVIILFITLIMGPDFFPIIKINGEILSEFTATTIILLMAKVFVGGLTLYTIYILRKLVRDFLKGILFTNFQIVTLNLVGQLIIFITVFDAFINFIGQLLLESEATIEIGMDHNFGSFWFILAVGLFFIYLSKIFKNAKGLKEENELTV